MKAFILLLFTFSLNASADSKCSQYELSGHIRRDGPNIVLTAAAKSLSEKTYQFDLPSRGSALPYIDQYVTGVFILKGDERIMKVISIKDDIYDPVSNTKKPISKKLKDTSCPQ